MTPVHAPLPASRHGDHSLVYAGRTAIQEVRITDGPHGRALYLDGVIQSAAVDEALYHELLVQPAMLRHACPRDVLIIGGGEGATLREVLRHPCVRSVTMVDIDGELMDIARQHLWSWHRGCFADPRVRLAIADGRAFVERDPHRYDVVIIDVVDRIAGGPAQQLYTQEFYRALHRHLRPGAIVVVQGLAFSFVEPGEHLALARTLRSVFSQVHSYAAFIPSFQEPWGFLLGSDAYGAADLQPAAFDQALGTRFAASALAHVDGSFIAGCLRPCKVTRALLERPGAIFLDDPARERVLRFRSPPR